MTTYPISRTEGFVGHQSAPIDPPTGEFEEAGEKFTQKDGLFFSVKNVNKIPLKLSDTLGSCVIFV